MVDRTDPVNDPDPGAAGKLRYPPMEMFHRFIRKDHAGFNHALAAALQLHEEYWSEGEPAFQVSGLVALTPLAVACFAHDVGSLPRSSPSACPPPFWGATGAASSPRKPQIISGGYDLPGGERVDNTIPGVGGLHPDWVSRRLKRLVELSGLPPTSFGHWRARNAKAGSRPGAAACVCWSRNGTDALAKEPHAGCGVGRRVWEAGNPGTWGRCSACDGAPGGIGLYLSRLWPVRCLRTDRQLPGRGGVAPPERCHLPGPRQPVR